MWKIWLISQEFIHLQISSFGVDFLMVLYTPYLYYGDLFGLIISETSTGWTCAWLKQSFSLLSKNIVKLIVAVCLPY